MSFHRPVIKGGGGLERPAECGDGLVALVNPSINSVDVDTLVTAAMMVGGMVQFGGMTAGRTFTFDTAAAFLAANTNMKVGDTYCWILSNAASQVMTLTAGAGWTFGNKMATLASAAMKFIFVTKTSETTVTATAS